MEVTNCSNTSNISWTAEEYLRHLQDNTNITMIPAVIMLVIFSITGLIGNSLVLIVYSQKIKLNPTKVLIMTIASFDLVANVAAIPIALVTMFDTWDFKRPVVCKATVFLASFTALGGAISLMIVALVRYRKVCKPYSWQVTVKQAIISSFATFILAFFFSVPYIIIYGTKTRETPCPNIKGSECFADDYYFYTNWPLLNNLLFVVLYLALSVSLVVLYSLIGLMAWRHRKLHGISHDAQVKIRDNSIPVVLSFSKESATIPDEPSRSSNGFNTDYAGLTGQHSKEHSVENTQSSNSGKTYTTTETEIDDYEPDSLTSNPYKVASSLNTSFSSTHSSGTPHSDNIAIHSDKNVPTEVRICELDPCKRELNGINNGVNDLTLGNDEWQRNPEQEQGQRKFQKQGAKSVDTKDASKQQSPVKRKEIRRPLGRMTAMLIIISAIFVLGFLPFLILTVFKNQQPKKYASMNMVEQTLYNFFYRLYFLNSAANPIIYSLCDANFRRKCLHFLTCKLRGRL